MPEAKQIVSEIEMHLPFRREKKSASESGAPAGQVTLHGQFTIENSAEIRNELKDALSEKPARLTVDLSDVSYIDTAGIATLLEASGLARKQGIGLTLTGLQGQPSYLLDVTHLARLFDIAGKEVAG